MTQLSDTSVIPLPQILSVRVLFGIISGILLYATLELIFANKIGDNGKIFQKFNRHGSLINSGVTIR